MFETFEEKRKQLAELLGSYPWFCKVAGIDNGERWVAVVSPSDGRQAEPRDTPVENWYGKDVEYVPHPDGFEAFLRDKNEFAREIGWVGVPESDDENDVNPLALLEDVVSMLRLDLGTSKAEGLAEAVESLMEQGITIGDPAGDIAEPICNALEECTKALLMGLCDFAATIDLSARRSHPSSESVDNNVRSSYRRRAVRVIKTLREALHEDDDDDAPDGD